MRQELGQRLEERIALLAPARRLRLAVTLAELERFAAGRDLRVLDAGCGDGLLTLEIAKRHPTWQVVGIDRRGDLLAQARERAARLGLANVRFKAGDLLEPPPESGFDAVLVIECLSEIPDDGGALRALVGALLPDGLLIAHVPEESWRPVLRGSSATWRDEVRHGYSAEAISQLMRAAGLAEIRVSQTYRATAMLAQEVRDRIKAKRLAWRLAAYPAMVAAAWLERRGVTTGPPRALLATGTRSSEGNG